jgi:hypothetical protein
MKWNETKTFQEVGSVANIDQCQLYYVSNNMNKLTDR